MDFKTKCISDLFRV